MPSVGVYTSPVGNVKTVATRFYRVITTKTSFNLVLTVLTTKLLKPCSMALAASTFHYVEPVISFGR